MAGRNSNKSRTSRKTTIAPDGYVSNLPRIRWKDGEKTELARLVRNYNQKRRRAIKRGIPESALPGVVRGRELRDKVINTRKDLKREIGELERFMKADLNKITNYGNVKISDYEMEEAKRLLRMGNRNVAKERARIEKIPVTSFGKPVTYFENGVQKQQTVGKMGRLKDHEFRELSIDVGGKDRYRWNKFMDVLRKRADPEYIAKKNWQLRQNYLISLHRVMGTSPYTVQITEKILQIDPAEFAAKYFSDTDITTIEYIYDENIDERLDRLEKIFDYFNTDKFAEFDTSGVEPDTISKETENFLNWYSAREASLRILDDDLFN